MGCCFVRTTCFLGPSTASRKVGLWLLTSFPGGKCSHKSSKPRALLRSGHDIGAGRERLARAPD